MMKCLVKKGFFILHDCGQTGTYQCDICQRHVCTTHVITNQGRKICTECLSKTDMALDEATNDAGHPGWREQFRRSYYSRHDYSPFYVGIYHHHYYDDHDYRGFDQTISQMALFDDTDNDDADFFDS